MIITVDCGTTNMRVRLYDGEKLVDEVRRKAGVRNTAFNGTADFLRVSLRECIEEILIKTKLSSADIEVVLSSGTLASDVGIYPIPHVIAPCGVNESAASAKAQVFPDISDIPILFIPGVKTLPKDDESDVFKKIELLESMSGEECETYGIMKAMGLKGDFVITLPGSYNKTLEIDPAGRIVSIKTGMCGEFIAAVGEHTLLRHSLPDPIIRTLIPEKLILGYEYCKKHGVSPTLIKARMVQFLSDWSADEAANFYVGAILRDDIMTTTESYKIGKKLVLGGSEPLKSVFRVLLLHYGVKESDLVCVDTDVASLASNYGAMEVYRAFKAKNN